VIRKADGTPAYNFAAVVTMLEHGHHARHPRRGAPPEHRRQALLYRALGANGAEFIHLGLILGPDGKKLSKRHGAASVAEYRKEGYLPEALVELPGTPRLVASRRERKVRRPR
jgi:glutamyl/glutaminyl-tRNA synthetase